jgi:hypothetical protein
MMNSHQPVPLYKRTARHLRVCGKPLLGYDMSVNTDNMRHILQFIHQGVTYVSMIIYVCLVQTVSKNAKI